MVVIVVVIIIVTIIVNITFSIYYQSPALRENKKMY